MQITSPHFSIAQNAPPPGPSNLDGTDGTDGTDDACDAGEILHELGVYPPTLAKRILEKLEAEKIPFEIEVDNTALADPLRGILLYMCMSPEGSKIRLFVMEPYLAGAKEIVQQVIPAEI
ncbi:MAG: hypothetical protein LBV28_04240 [Puniceicoccales bacterium]|jgi:hypothetical protein|nr:hypothetical protein [Puniceicoccales bacterium]